MRAVRFESFRTPPALVEVPDPACPPRGAVITVQATGVCRSDWHAWQGHDDSVRLPHVPGHEFAGVVREVGEEVSRVAVGDRVTAPFILSCGRCPQCLAGAPQVCPAQQQPGFDLQGSWAEQVVVLEADHNLVALPDGIDMTLAAGLGCRVGTAWHAVRAQAAVRPGETVAVFGCGGLGLACVMIALAAGAEVIAVDVSPAALAAAESLGATALAAGPDVVDHVRERTGGGAHVTLDALGAAATAHSALEVLRPRGRHVQVGLLLGDDADPALPMGRVISQELQILGSHGLAVAEYSELLADVAAGRLDLAGTVGRVLEATELPAAMLAMDRPPTSAGMTVARWL
ncbi:zinc-dependent alcohol dehydrogenase family protein [Brachybacterium saurashtrense]|uniref:Alcohol dehydrogenase n=1 Tax=Brachybacterium saurashtrense TaxID=556288 RepID=A0A345YKC6_9MICO|nr:zinc-dependent alcohol dehydrogenase family protein [Brachybacterium saurashtrense]AXK44378.1 alcohol dehydrogenase [Brachybacterium saurashtrense]RRR22989.1 alcohol dehydrogenase [Brachybacterium saurashtrense]